ncbi:MAG: Hsp20/alpha crystallin family protein, partial [Gammaproteobacteria bacterium]
MAERQTKSEKQEKQRPLARRGEGGGLAPFEDVDRWFDDAFRDFFSRRWLSPWFERGASELRAPFEGRMPKVDIVDRENDICLRAELPGVSKDDLEVSMTDNNVTIRASTKHEEHEEKGGYHRREMSRGEFQRTVSLPVEVKGEEAKASFKDGILELVFPK